MVHKKQLLTKCIQIRVPLHPFTARVLDGVLKGDCNFCVCGWNPMMWPFKWKLPACTYTWYFLFFKMLENEIWKSGRNLPLTTFGSGRVKVARYSFSRSIPPKFERKLRRHKQRFGKIDTTVVLDKEENWLWSGLQWHRSCHSNEMMPLPILLAAVFLGTGNCSSKIVYWSFYLR